MNFPPPFTDALILTGPTASGKSALALELAARLNAEIVCMDSMTLYRGMDIGTAKPTPDERASTPHHLVDVLDPWESGNVAWWLEQAGHACREIQKRGKQALFVGGTPFYLKAVMQGLFECPPVDPALRQRLEEEARVIGLAAMHDRLAQIDPESARRLHPNDSRRVIRAIEIWQLTGERPSRLQKQGWWDEGNSASETGQNESKVKDGLSTKSLAKEIQWASLEGSPGRNAAATSGAIGGMPRCLAIDIPRPELYTRIDRRVVQMIEAGWIEEVQRLRQLPRPWAKEPSQALGYREISAYLDGKATLESTISAIQMRSRQFAKRQLTWFRGLPGCLLCEGKLTFHLWHRKMS